MWWQLNWDVLSHNEERAFFYFNSLKPPIAGLTESAKIRVQFTWLHGECWNPLLLLRRMHFNVRRHLIHVQLHSYIFGVISLANLVHFSQTENKGCRLKCYRNSLSFVQVPRWMMQYNLNVRRSNMLRLVQACAALVPLVMPEDWLNINIHLYWTDHWLITNLLFSSRCVSTSKSAR